MNQPPIVHNFHISSRYPHDSIQPLLLTWNWEETRRLLSSFQSKPYESTKFNQQEVIQGHHACALTPTQRQAAIRRRVSYHHKRYHIGSTPVHVVSIPSARTTSLSFLTWEFPSPREDPSPRDQSRSMTSPGCES